MLAINNEKNNIDLSYMPERPTDVQKRRKSSDASQESSCPSEPSSTPPSPPSYDLFVSHNLREIKQPIHSQKLYESNEPTFDNKLSYIFKEHSDVLEDLLSSDPALTNMIYDMMNISITNKIDPVSKKHDEQGEDEQPKEEEPKEDTNNNEITYDDIYNNDEVYDVKYKRACIIN